MKTKLKLGKIKIPVNEPKIFNLEKKNVLKCLNTGWISSQGKFVTEFEKKFANFNKRRFGISVSSGTAALEIALKSLNLKKNDEVIIPTFTIISSISAELWAIATELKIIPVRSSANLLTAWFK